MAGRRPAGVPTGMYASFAALARAYVRTGETAFDLLRTYVRPPASLRWRALVLQIDQIPARFSGRLLHIVGLGSASISSPFFFPRPTVFYCRISLDWVFSPPFSFVLFDGYLFVFII
jgi:hypothetical protein